MISFKEYLTERKTGIIKKVNSKGKVRRKKQCRPGFKLVDNKCVVISGGDKAKKKKASRQMARTKKSKGSALQNRTNIKTARAKRKRKGMGIK